MEISYTESGRQPPEDSSGWRYGYTDNDVASPQKSAPSDSEWATRYTPEGREEVPEAAPTTIVVHQGFEH